MVCLFQHLLWISTRPCCKQLDKAFCDRWLDLFSAQRRAIQLWPRLATQRGGNTGSLPLMNTEQTEWNWSSALILGRTAAARSLSWQHREYDLEFHSLVFMESDRRRQKVWNLFTVELRQSKQKHLRLPLKCPSTNISSLFWEFLPAELRTNNWSTSRLISLMVRPLAAPGHQQRGSHRGHHNSVLQDRTATSNYSGAGGTRCIFMASRSAVNGRWFAWES